MQIISVYNSKGGTCKSTVARELAATFAMTYNLRVLCIDGDPQGTLTNAFPRKTTPTQGYRELIGSSRVDWQAIAVPTTVEGVNVVCANLSLNELSSILDSSQESYLRLRIRLDDLKKMDLYDVVIIDSPGTPGIVSYVTAIAGDIILSPIIPDRVNVEAYFTGIPELLRDLSSNPYAPYKDTPIYAVISRMSRTADAEHFRRYLREQLQPDRLRGSLLERITLIDIDIPEATAYKKASTLHVPVASIDAKQRAIFETIASTLVPGL